MTIIKKSKCDILSNITGDMMIENLNYHLKIQFACLKATMYWRSSWRPVEQNTNKSTKTRIETATEHKTGK